ncbi:MAG: AbrB/MazE/SpoVT family DNA-binding domain-containing protein [Bacteroidota bacterium]
METAIIKIGNSKSLRLSKQILEQYQIEDKVEMIFEKDRIILKPLRNPREGWDKAFKKMAKEDEDQLLINDVFDDEGLEEWS